MKSDRRERVERHTANSGGGKSGEARLTRGLEGNKQTERQGKSGKAGLTRSLEENKQAEKVERKGGLHKLNVIWDDSDKAQLRVGGKM
jgi:hypothetical protein